MSLSGYFACDKGSDAKCNTAALGSGNCCGAWTVVWDGDVTKMDSTVKSTLVDKFGLPTKSSDGTKYLCMKSSTLQALESTNNMLVDSNAGIFWTAYCAFATKVTASAVAAGAIVFASSF